MNFRRINYCERMVFARKDSRLVGTLMVLVFLAPCRPAEKTVDGPGTNSRFPAIDYPGNLPQKRTANDRRFHIINLSLPRTGTGSMWGLFSRYRSRHEFRHQETVSRLLDLRAGKQSPKAVAEFLFDRDQAARPEMDSANFFHIAPRLITRIFPDARYLLCVRDPGRWIQSFTGMMRRALNHPSSQGKEARQWLRRYMSFVSDKLKLAYFESAPSIRENRKVIASELARFWTRGTRASLKAIEAVPPDRRLVIKTSKINDSLQELARLAKIPVKKLVRKKRHLNKDRAPNETRRLLGRALLRRVSGPPVREINQLLQRVIPEERIILGINQTSPNSG